MQIAMIGLGRMGGNMARRLQKGGAKVVGFNRSFEVTKNLARECGISAAASLKDALDTLPQPRITWLMLPAGEATETTIKELAPLLAKHDIVIDGANAFYKDSIRRAAYFKARDIGFVDAGVSGGVWGLENGYALMLGGESIAIEQLLPFIKILAPAPDRGWLHCGPSGSGHYVKMIHNGIEYGMMQALAEGLALLRSRDDFNLDLAHVTEMWRHGSVVRSWLLDLTAQFLKEDQSLVDIQPLVADSGEGRWTAMEAIERGVPTPVMSLALMMRFASQGKNDYTAKLLAMMRKGFGGHAVSTGEKNE